MVDRPNIPVKFGYDILDFIMRTDYDLKEFKKFVDKLKKDLGL
jgi:hypothetical protein